MRKIFANDQVPDRWGIQVDGAIEYEPELEYDEAVALVNAHNAGASSYDEALRWIHEHATGAEVE